MSDRREEGLSDAIIKAIANLIASLLILTIASCWEFVLNPSNHYSVYVEGTQTYTVSGVECHGDRVSWHFQMKDTWYGYKKAYAKLIIWVQDKPESQSRLVQEIDIHEGGELYLEGCPGESADTAYLWSISSSKLWMHLRVREFEFGVDQRFSLPQGGDK